MKEKSLLLTPYVFKCLYREVLGVFYGKDPLRKELKNFQLFGFDHYDESMPSLKQDLEKNVRFHVNGKYLYNKIRDMKRGASPIKLDKKYKSLLLDYIGYSSLDAFLKGQGILDAEQEKQKELVERDDCIEDMYYISYYYGEDGKIIKGQVKIYDNWGQIVLKFFYETYKGFFDFYTHQGSIEASDGLMGIHLKMQQHNKKQGSGCMSFFVGKALPESRPFLMGTYSGFDRDNTPVCGRILLEKKDNEKEMIVSFQRREIDPVISDMIRNQRIHGLGFIPTHKTQFSENSPFQSQLLRYVGGNTLFFIDKKGELIDFLPLKIETLEVGLSLFSSGMINMGRISLTHKAQVLSMEFEINGIFKYISVFVQVSTDEVSQNCLLGHFTAINKQNMTDGGIVVFLRGKGIGSRKKAASFCINKLGRLCSSIHGAQSIP